MRYRIKVSIESYNYQELIVSVEVFFLFFVHSSSLCVCARSVSFLTRLILVDVVHHIVDFDRIVSQTETMTQSADHIIITNSFIIIKHLMYAMSVMS